MLLEVIFLVLSAVVLTVVGVGAIDVRYVDKLSKGRVSGRHILKSDGNNLIEVARKVKLNGEYVDVPYGGLKVTENHEIKHAQGMDYESGADIAALTQMVSSGYSPATITSAATYLEAIGRTTTYQDLVHLLKTGQYPQSNKGRKAWSREVLKQYGIPERYLVPQYAVSNGGISSSQDMRLLTKDMKKDGGEALRTLGEYLGGGLEKGVNLYNEVDAAVKGVKYDPATKTYDTKSIKEFSAKKQKDVLEGAIKLLKGK